MACMSHSQIYEIAPIPNRTMGCQNLLKDVSMCVHSGWLRRQSMRNKLKIFAWPQVYVAIAGGCVYCYSNERSRKPVSAFSLYGYDKVFRAGEVTEKEATWSFKVVHVNLAYRSYLFSASSEKEMTHWMAHIKQEMLRANGKLPRTDKTCAVRTPADGSCGDSDMYLYNDGASGSAGSISSQELKDIEASIYEDSSNFVLPSDYTNKKEDDDSDVEMDQLVLTRPDLQDRPPLPPPVPHRPGHKKQQSQTAASQAIVNELKQLKVSDTSSKGSAASPKKSSQDSGKPAVNRTAKPLLKQGEDSTDSDSGKKEDEDEDAREFWSSIFFYGGKEKAADIITKIADDGVYLVRVNEDKSMVLHVFGKQQARKFQIFNFEDQLALDRDCEHFDRVEDMVCHYYNKPVPRLDLYLTECYLHHPAYHSISWS